MGSLVDLMREHPRATPLVPSRLLVNEAGRDLTECVLDKLAVAGFTIEAAKLAMLQSLPADRYPRLRAASPSMVECSDSDEYYGAAIDIFVAGVMADAHALAR